MKKAVKNIVLLCIVSPFFIACGSSESKTVEAHPTTYNVIINEMQFHPDELNLHKGDTVIWVNDGIVVHDITGQPDDSWGSPGLIAIGNEWKTVITEDISYICSIHPTMTGKIVIIQE